MTRSPPRAGAQLATVLGFAALLFLAFAFGLRMVWFGAEAPLPPLLQDLPDSRSEADQQILFARLHKQFPAGAGESDMIAELRRQGFRLAKPTERVATYDRPAGINDKCRRSGNVRWSADANGKLTDVTGGYYQHCP